MKQKESVFGSYKFPLDKTIEALTINSDLLKGDMVKDIAIAIRDKGLQSIFDLTEGDFKFILSKNMFLCSDCNISSHIFKAVFELDEIIQKESVRLQRLQDSLFNKGK